MEKNKTYGQTEGRPANMRLASCGVKCLNSSSVFQINFSAGLTVLCPEIPHERQAPNRCVLFLQHCKNEKN
ncbi:hypothetical protein CHX27_03325 [Flavobacterium aurantiibacter]|uniref:Uncharacterized protein n=1 Tax=Flavobacterium aurantiibacter TaxID=2023067 RepID=A0A256A0K3_9FLAO|nr:hypothetical protein CHX27_03325 [Flavobacterium aurantiibacter]